VSDDECARFTASLEEHRRRPRRAVDERSPR
jgi:hypothetical protein